MNSLFGLCNKALLTLRELSFPFAQSSLIGNCARPRSDVTHTFSSHCLPSQEFFLSHNSRYSKSHACMKRLSYPRGPSFLLILIYLPAWYGHLREEDSFSDKGHHCPFVRPLPHRPSLCCKERHPQDSTLLSQPHDRNGTLEQQLCNGTHLTQYHPTWALQFAFSAAPDS